MREIRITAMQEGMRLDRMLTRYLKNASSGFVYKMLRKKNITLNGKKATGSEKLKSGDSVKLFFADETLEKFTGIGVSCEEIEADSEGRHTLGSVRRSDSPAAASRGAARARSASGVSGLPENPGLDIVYEDENILLINKPAGLLTQKAKAEDVSLNELALAHLIHEGAVTKEDLLTFRPSVCNRLDRNTSGIVAVGKNIASLQELSQMFRDRSVKKFYRCLTVGCIEEDQTIEGYLTKDEKTNTVSVSPKPAGADSREIKTACHVLALSDSAKDADPSHALTYLEVELITGRTHQIRAHLASEGHPIVGDPKYGYKRRNDYYFREYHIHRQLLHAVRLEFPKCEGRLSYLSGRSFTAGIPADMQKLLEGVSLIDM